MHGPNAAPQRKFPESWALDVERSGLASEPLKSPAIVAGALFTPASTTELHGRCGLLPRAWIDRSLRFERASVGHLAADPDDILGIVTIASRFAAPRADSSPPSSKGRTKRPAGPVSSHDAGSRTYGTSFIVVSRR
jgi:hypothetical protein